MSVACVIGRWRDQCQLESVKNEVYAGGRLAQQMLSFLQLPWEGTTGVYLESKEREHVKTVS